jgi:hypothetical protein
VISVPGLTQVIDATELGTLLPPALCRRHFFCQRFLSTCELSACKKNPGCAYGPGFFQTLGSYH